MKLKDCCVFIRGLTYKKSDEVDFSANAVLRANNVNLVDGSLDFSELKYISDAIDIPHDKIVKKGDILICTASGSKSHLGKVALIDRDYGYAFGGFMAVLKPFDFIEPRYLHAMLNSPFFKAHIFQIDGANINNLKFSDMEDFEIPVPSLPEQKRIVGILDAAFGKIDAVQRNAERNLANAKELFQRVLDEEMTVFSSFLPLKDICTITTGKLNANAAVVDGKYPFFTCSRDVYRIDSYSFDCEALLLAGNNASGDFNVKYFNGKFDAYQRTYVIHGFKGYSPEFLFHILQYNLSILKSLSLGANTRYLKIGMIENILLPKIPIKQQKTLAIKINGLCDFCRASSEKINMIRRKCLDLKQQILTKAFNGEL